jgi:hypothetical protein
MASKTVILSVAFAASLACARVDYIDLQPNPVVFKQ